MPDFSRIINMAYMRILGRPADPGGLEGYDRSMNQGMTEAMMRESLLRSPEYAMNNPDQAVQAAAASKRRSPPAKKKTKAKGPKKKTKPRR